MTLQLAYRSITIPFGVVEDVLVKVCHFTFPMDFVIMNIEEDVEIPLILGRPFMVTAKCIVDIGNGNLEMSVEDQKATFNLFEGSKHPSDSKTCFKVEEVEQKANLIGSFHLNLCVMPPIMHLGMFCRRELIDYHMSLLTPHHSGCNPSQLHHHRKRAFSYYFCIR